MYINEIELPQFTGYRVVFAQSFNDAYIEIILHQNLAPDSSFQDLMYMQITDWDFGKAHVVGVNPTLLQSFYRFVFVISKIHVPIFYFVLQVNDIAFHPVHGTLATVGSDCKFSFWDKDARTKLKTSDQFDQPLTSCCFNPQGNVFCYATSYDWSKVSATNFISCKEFPWLVLIALN